MTAFVKKPVHHNTRLTFRMSCSQTPALGPLIEKHADPPEAKNQEDDAVNEAPPVNGLKRAVSRGGLQSIDVITEAIPRNDGINPSTKPGQAERHHHRVRFPSSQLSA